MGTKANTNSKKEEKKENNFEEFNFKSSLGNHFNGRFYKDTKSKGVKRHFINLEFASGFSIHCHLVETNDKYFITFPQYEVKNGNKTEYKSYCYVAKDSDFDKEKAELEDMLFEKYLK